MICRACHSLIREDSARFCPECGVEIAREPSRIQRGSTLILQQWARVTLAEPLGEGGMGVVYRAQLEYLPTGPLAGTPAHPVAVKVLRPELRSRERARRMFQREAIALERLAHPNIVRFVGLYTDQEQIAIVMEFVRGRSLSEVIRQGELTRAAPSAACVPLSSAWHYLAQLLGALAAVHALGILHRDVKSANVLVRADGVAKLTDFGIARLPENDPKNTGGVIAGTGAYMAPEHVRGEEIDPRADLYAAAVVFYEMITGRTPFDTPDRDELMVRTAQLEEAPPPLGQGLANVPPALDVVMARALAKDRRHRYGTALELGEAMRTALGIEQAPLWTAQRQFAAIARTISAAVPAAGSELVQQAEQLRTAMMTPLGH